MTLDSEQRRALEMLAGNPRGITEAVLATLGSAGDLLAGLVRDGMATVASETLWAEGRPTEVVRVKITEAGQQALRGGPFAALMKMGLQGIEWVILRDHSGGKACG